MKVKFIIEGLDCPNCGMRLSKMLSSEDGIDNASVNFLAEELTVESELDEDTLLKKVKAVGKAFSKSVSIKKKGK